MRVREVVELVRKDGGEAFIESGGSLPEGSLRMEERTIQWKQDCRIAGYTANTDE